MKVVNTLNRHVISLVFLLLAVIVISLKETRVEGMNTAKSASAVSQHSAIVTPFFDVKAHPVFTMNYKRQPQAVSRTVLKETERTTANSDYANYVKVGFVRRE